MGGLYNDFKSALLHIHSLKSNSQIKIQKLSPLSIDPPLKEARTLNKNTKFPKILLKFRGLSLFKV